MTMMMTMLYTCLHSIYPFSLVHLRQPIHLPSSISLLPPTTRTSTSISLPSCAFFSLACIIPPTLLPYSLYCSLSPPQRSYFARIPLFAWTFDDTPDWPFCCRRLYFLLFLRARVLCIFEREDVLWGLMLQIVVYLEHWIAFVFFFLAVHFA
jgi:hypothetical protein